MHDTRDVRQERVDRPPSDVVVLLTLAAERWIEHFGPPVSWSLRDADFVHVAEAVWHGVADTQQS